MIDRLPPHSIEAEQGVLGCILLDPTESLTVCAEHIGDTKTFYDLRHRTLFEVLLAMHAAGKPIDLISVNQRLKDEGKLDSTGGLAYISNLQDLVPSAAHINHYLEILREKHQLRRLVSACSGILARIDQSEGNIAELVATAEQDILNVQAGFSVERMSESMLDLSRDAINRWQDAASGKPRSGIPFTMPGITRLLRWADGARFVVVGARPSVGKSSVLLHLADEAAKCGNPVGIVTLEMPKEEVYDRLTSRETQIPYQQISGGELSVGAQKQLATAITKIKSRPIWVADRPVSFHQLSSLVRRWIHKHSIRALFVDYLGLVAKANPRDSIYEHTTAVSQGLKRLALEHRICVVAAAQLNRANESESREPRLSDLRDSGSVEQDADIVILMSENSDRPGELTLNCAKQRGGMRGKCQVRFNAATCSFGQVIED